MPRKKIAYISGTRADFGLMTPVLQAIEKSEKLSLQVYATGMHLMPEFGETIQEVTKIFPNVQRIECVFESDDRAGMAKFAGALLPNVVATLSKDRPDFVILLGDRVEMLAIATACLYLGIPTGHLHGGERTGTSDEIARHAITKLSSLHLPATAEGAERITKMGEDEWRVEIVGAPALDVILHTKLPEPREVSVFSNLPASEKFVLLVQHPGEQSEDSGTEMEKILSALKKIALPVVAVYPNADAGSQNIISALEKERTNPLFRIFRNIPYEMFLALERDASVLVGNSSSALIESASFKTPVVTVGERQKGRLCGRNVLHVPCEREKIVSAIQKSLHPDYLASLQGIENPWGDGKTGPRVAKLLEELTIDAKLLNKQISY
ncbi:MAG: UDP-N-acetylglucosamine 2-epimerase [bacterium]|nr:UDP-N-acetylglucosamine 2-epimerase [bacterium]